MIDEAAKTADVAELEEEEWPEAVPDLEEEWPEALVDLEGRESVDAVADFEEESADAVLVAFER